MWQKLPLDYHHIASADNGWVKAAAWICLAFVTGIFNRIGLGHSESLEKRSRLAKGPNTANRNKAVGCNGFILVLLVAVNRHQL